MEKSEYPIEIPSNKQKIILFIIGALVFIAAGIWIVSEPETFKNERFSNTTFIAIIGILAIILSGLALFFFSRKMFESTPAIIIDQTGITDNTSMISIGHILWEDMKEIIVKKVGAQERLVVIVNNPEKYIDRYTKAFYKNAAKYNYQNYGSPVIIQANLLNYDLDELKNILKSELKKNKGE